MEKVKAIKITGDNSAILSTSLSDILGCIEGSDTIFWTILWVNGTVKEDSELSILDFEQKVNKSANGVPLSWQELEYLALCVNQMIEFLIIGNFKPENSIRYSDDTEMYDKCSYVIELIDSSYWEVHSIDHLFLERVKRKLEGVYYI